MDESTRALVFAPEFQRLRYVRLCNINSLYLTGASEPKRFEHCIGVYHLANLWIAPRTITARAANIIRAAALLHDIQTGPFGHSFQYVLEDNAFEQTFEHSNLEGGVHSGYYQLAAAGAHFAGRPFSLEHSLGDIAREVFEAVRGEGPFGPLISGTLDLDNLDNVIRLAFHMGLCGDDDRRIPVILAPLLEPTGGGLAVGSGGRKLIQRWFEIRRELYDFLLLDRGEFSAKAMLTLAVEMASQGNLIGPDSWRFTDEEFLEYLHSESVGEKQFIAQVIKRLKVGDLFDCIGVWSSDNTSFYDANAGAERKRYVERRIEDMILTKYGVRMRICVHYILDRRKTRRSIRFFDFGTSSEVVVGSNSNALLVGVFLINSRSTGLGRQDRIRYATAAAQVLSSEGLTDLRSSKEPLAENESSQELFSL